MSSSTEHPSILNVDADEAGRLVISRLLREAGYAVREAGSGEEALVLAKREAPDLILLKVNLPGLGGFETARRLKADPATDAVPVLMLSADAAESSTAAGDAERLAEPVERSALLATVKALLRARQAEQARRETKAQLEARVKERTAELERVNRALQQEIAERQRAEESVKAERQRFIDVLDTLPAYLVLLTPDYHVPFANRFFRERFGESLGRRCFEYLFQRSEPCETCETYNALKSMAPYEWEWTGPDGRNYYIYDFPFTDTDGSTLIMEVGLDITERERAEEELRRHRDHLEELVRERTADLARRNAQLAAEIAERERAEQDRERLLGEIASQRALLDAIVENTEAHLVYLDRDFNFLRVNAAYAKACRRAPEEFIGHNHFEFYPHEENEAIFRRVRDTGEPFEIKEKPFVFPDMPERGTTYWDWTLTPIKNDEGEVAGLVFALTDVTEQVKAREQLLAAERARAQLAESLNAEISHRVKNNLAMVAGLLQVEIMEQSDPKVLTALHDAAARLLTFAGIHELMQAGHAEEIDLLAAARRIAEATRYVFAGGKMDLRVQGETICYSSRAATNVAVVINELITNAAKHGAPSAGGLLRIELQIELQQGRLHLAVWNSGNPIAAGFEVAKQKNMGLRMVREIVMNQYDGSFSLRPQDGGTLAEVLIADARLRQ